MKQQTALHPTIKICLAKGEDRFFGPGVRELLKGIRQYGSLRIACQNMGLSYSKGRKILKNLEERLQVPVIQCVRGGNSGGSTELTEQGCALLEQYIAFETQIRQYADVQFQHYFPLNQKFVSENAE